MKRFTTLALVAILSLAAASAWSYYKLVGTHEVMSAKGKAFLDTLGPKETAVAVLDYDSPQRLDWHFIPKDNRKGLQVRNMNDAQRKAAHALLHAALSEAGYKKATQIMEMENLLLALQKKSGKTTPIRDPERYYFTVFGKPGGDLRWGLSVEGHHMSLNFVIDNEQVISTTPAMFGANPATVLSEVIPAVPKGTRILKAEEQLAFDLLASLTPAQKATAIIDKKAIAELRAAGEAQPPQTSPDGLKVADMTDEQAQTLHKLIEAYAGNWPADVAKQRLASIEKAGYKNVQFAWAGAEKPGIGHYYRVQGPTFLIEFVNTQPDAAGNPANHIHCAWRDMEGDFGIALKRAPNPVSK